eukprot:GFUD01121597.1.p1 GENE.GFUD01121597.1~~GFUD01121597.1.p1  ORF type:complete len:140 (+),score=47.16 GFUD01121597.1:90-509(+)
MEGAGAGPPAGRGGRGAALLAALKAKQKRPGDDEGARVGLADGGAGVSNQPPPPVQDITHTPQPSGSPHPLPVGRAALLSGLTGRSLGGVASSVSAPSVVRAALLEKLKIKGGVASSLASVGTVPEVGNKVCSFCNLTH